MISLSNRTLIGCLQLGQKSFEQRLTHKMMAARMKLVGDAQIIQSNAWKANFYFPKYSVSLSQSSADTIGKLKAVGKIRYTSSPRAS